MTRNVILSPLVPCPGPGCTRQFRRDWQRRSACSDRCIEELRRIGRFDSKGILLHPSWHSVSIPSEPITTKESHG